MSLNKVLLLGHLGKDPEIKSTSKGSVCTFSVATNESWRDSTGSQQEKTEWHSIVVFGRLADYCYQYLAKGTQVFIEGKISTSSWEGKDGKKQYKTDIVASKVERAGNTNSNKQHNDSENEVNMEDFHFAPDDVPF